MTDKVAGHDGSALSDGLGPMPDTDWTQGAALNYSAAQMRAYAAQAVAAERERLLALVEELRDANCAAQGVESFQLLTLRQEKAWNALRAAIS